LKGNKGGKGKGIKRGKGKRGGGEQGGQEQEGGLLGRVEGKEGGMYPLVNSSSPDDYFLQKNISRQGRGGSQSTGTC